MPKHGWMLLGMHCTSRSGKVNRDAGLRPCRQSFGGFVADEASELRQGGSGE